MVYEIEKTINDGELTKFMSNAIQLTESHDPLSVIAA